MSTPAETLIAPHGRATPARQQVLQTLLAASHALSHGEIEDILGGGLDRVTLYRVLDWLVGQGLAHKIAGEDRIWRFNAVGEGEHSHAHFRCTTCGQVFCLADLKPNLALRLPLGFQLQKAELNLQGQCPQCSGGALS